MRRVVRSRLTDLRLCLTRRVCPVDLLAKVTSSQWVLSDVTDVSCSLDTCVAVR